MNNLIATKFELDSTSLTNAVAKLVSRHDEIVLHDALVELESRMSTERMLSPSYNKKGFHRLGVPDDWDEIELAIFAILALASPRRQFSVQGDGDVFMTMHNGYHHPEDRIRLSGISAVLDCAGARFYASEPGVGGRLTVRRHEIVVARNGELVLPVGFESVSSTLLASWLER